VKIPIQSSLGRLRASAILLLGLTSLLSGACNGPAHAPIVGEPKGHPGFPSETLVGDVWAEARFVRNHKRVLGQNLTKDRGVIPITLRLGRRSGTAGLASIDKETLDPVLYLEDGTALPWVPLDELGHTSDALGSNALSTSIIPAWEDSRAGFLFFTANNIGVRLSGRHALVIGEHLNRELDLIGSVLAFTITTPAGPQRVHLGLSLDTWELDR
jgi:hypothetical protein